MNDIDISALVDEYIEDANGHVDSIESSLLKIEKAAAEGIQASDIMTAVLGSLHTLKGNSGMMGYASIQKYVHSLESILKAASEGKVLLSPLFFETFFAAVSSLREAFRSLAENPTATPEFVDEMMALDALSLEEAQQAVPVGTSSPSRRKEEFTYVTQKSNTLKVNFEKLDELLNLVGELVIHRTSLVTLEGKLKEKVKDREILEAFSESSQQVGKTAAELREAIMKVRMLPVRVVFQRFIKMVRDLSHLHGKEVALVFEGEDTEIDKTVIDEIGEPLLHLIRNAVDHGIESPRDRQAEGKPREATLLLRARHESNHIVISVSDDGRGISAEKIREAAVAKGLIDAPSAAALPDAEALQMIFLPGFSTRIEVTETSGRGIGLDVVKKIVSTFNGIIDIDSRVGHGTTFTLRLPLTLAIISALMVEVSGQTYAVPLSGVLESIRAASAEIHSIGGRELITLRDRLLPLVRLDSFFGLPSHTDRESEYVVVVGSGEKRAGIIVDRLVGQQEIVIKALDDYLGEVRGISGGTVLGDGRISLIVDIATLVTTAGTGGAHGR